MKKPITFLLREPKFGKTLYIDKDGVLNDVVIRGAQLSSPRCMSEVILNSSLEDLKTEIKKKVQYRNYLESA